MLLDCNHHPCRDTLMGTCHKIPNSTCALRCRHPAQGRLAQQVLPYKNLTVDTVETDLILQTTCDRTFQWTANMAGDILTLAKCK